jgi:hypothetical protein
VCDENHERRVEAKVQVLLETVDKNPPQRIKPYDVQKLINSSRSRQPPESHLTLNERNITFVNRMVTWRLHIEINEPKAFRTFIRVYSLFKIERLSANIKLNLHKSLIRSVMTCYSAWEFEADIHLMKLQRLQNKVLGTISK